MHSKTIAVLVIFIAVLGFTISGSVFAEDNTLVIQSFQTVTGELADVDVDHNRVTIHWMSDDVRLKYQDTLMDVPDACVIVKNGRTIGLHDLESGDHATVRFDSNGVPLPKASSIVVTE